MKSRTILPSPLNMTGWQRIKGQRQWFKITISGQWRRIKDIQTIRDLNKEFPLKGLDETYQ